MQTTQLTCPHCGSTLSFGKEVVTGTPVECLICMQSFVAEVSSTAASAGLESQPSTLPSLVNEMQTGEAPSSGIDDSANSVTLPDIDTNTLPGVDRLLDLAAPAPIVCDPPPDAAILASKRPPSGKPAKAKPAAKEGILVSKPYVPPASTAITEKSVPPAQGAPMHSSADFSIPTAPPVGRQTTSGIGGKVALTVAALALLFLLVAGVGIAAWKITSSAQQVSTPPVPDGKDKIAANDKKQNPEGPSGGSGTGEDVTPPPPLTEEEEEDIRVKLRQELRQRLTRTPTSKKDGGLSFDPVSSLNVTRQKIAGLDQERINAAIDKGVKFLKRTQNANGTWHSGHGVGHASLGGLTLLECGVQKNKDMTVQRAAQYVRDHCANLASTYELSLAILFLDRLGYERDRPLIQGMALRLMAGQNDTGGWTYSCPLVSQPDMFQLYNFLQSNKKPDLLNPLGKTKTASGIALNPVRDPGTKLSDPFQELNTLILTRGIEGGNAKSGTDPKKGGLISPVYTDSAAKDAKKDLKDNKSSIAKTPVKPIPPEALSPALRKLPIVMGQGLTKKKQPKIRFAGGDNSNTQFAMLALWAARRHDIPTDQALLTAYQRFLDSQNNDGGWGYAQFQGTTHTMTNVGLLGHAMGHGVAPEIIQLNPKNPKDFIVKPALEDSKIQKGLEALARYIGQPTTDEKQTKFTMQNLYFLWSVERVAMLYDLKTIGGKDWYGWGAQILVHNQAKGGEWPQGFYHGQNAALNTCFALLFLKRSNLVQDLTDNLRLDAGIREP